MGKKEITVRLQGGLGNQLFILTAGLAQARRLGCALSIDTSLFVAGKSWPIEATQLRFEGLQLRESGRSQNPRLIGVFDRLAPSVFEEKSFSFDPRIFEVQPGTTLAGYFQSEKYFSSVKEEVFKAIDSLVFDGIDLEALNMLKDVEYISLHVRRGDYVSNPEALEVHGLAGKRYFQQAVEVIRKQTGIYKVVVFSDDIPAAKSELQNIEGLDFYAVPGELSNFATLKIFSLGQGFIISNSTFSWWGAWVGQMRSMVRPVIAPRPWFTTNMPTQDLIPDNWLTLGR